MDRIIIDPAVMGGVPCLRGLRIPVATVVNMVAGGMSALMRVAEEGGVIVSGTPTSEHSWRCRGADPRR